MSSLSMSITAILKVSACLWNGDYDNTNTSALNCFCILSDGCTKSVAIGLTATHKHWKTMKQMKKNWIYLSIKFKTPNHIDR